MTVQCWAHPLVEQKAALSAGKKEIQTAEMKEWRKVDLMGLK
jgi:hypothetical protein